MNRRWLIVVILALGYISARAEGPAPITDPAQVSAHYREVVARPKYQEIAEPDISSNFEDSLSQWFLRLGKKFGQFQYSGDMPAVASLLMTLLVILGVAGLLYVIIRLTRRGKMEMEPSIRTFGPKTFRPPEFYDDEIQQATREGNWHGAWLAGWRQFLSRLENRQLVEADRTRTNREYLAQLRTRSLPASALDLVVGMVDVYDRTIYGRRPVAEPDWARFHQQIEEAALLLHLNDKDAPVRIKPPAA